MPRLHAPTALPQKPLQHSPAMEQPVSPTLTNPDYILPSGELPTIHSPPRLTRRPPSPGYLRENSTSPQPPMAKKERHHLSMMSRKMMLLRGRTSSGGTQASGKSNAWSSPTSSSPGFIPSSPILQDVGNLAPEQPEFLQLPDTDRHSNSGGSSASDMSGLAGFLERHANPDGVSDDEALYEGEQSPVTTKFPSSATEAEEEFDEERRKQRQEEYNSVILSKRAEQILANAKKRLNVMEGNLRGARDLVAPLTAANLKRASSLGSAQYTASYARRQMNADHDSHVFQSPRQLTTQASSPSIGRDYQYHARVLSENDMQERPYTSLEHLHERITRSGHTSTRSSDFGLGLRASKSYDSLGPGGGVGHGISRDRYVHPRDSPDPSQLETLQEDDERRSVHNSGSDTDGVNNGLGIYRPSSRTSDLREQMTSLKGKISTLKERAREDSLRRQSQSNLKQASPFNNALASAPEFFYTSSASYGSPILDTNAGVGWTSNSSASPASPQKVWDHDSPVTGSRNAFAEQAANQEEHALQQTPKACRDHSHELASETAYLKTTTTHWRTPSGTAVVQSAKNRYSHHQRDHSLGIPEPLVEGDDYLEVPSPGFLDQNYDSSSGSSGPHPRTEDSYAPSEDGTSVSEDAISVYEDAQDEPSAIVAHEDREDAFDYKHFFLHSAMATYGNGRRNSHSSEGSISSIETAKGPAGVEEDEEDQYDLPFAPPTPETPERLREIERNLHSRAYSSASLTTVDTFATAEEDPISPIEQPVETFGYGARQLVSPEVNAFRASSRAGSQQSIGTERRPASRPSTAVRRAAQEDSSSDRADSGVGIPRRSIGSNDATPLPPHASMTTPKPTKARSGSVATTPPTSPYLLSRQDPATIAVNALLNPNGKSLGLRNKAVLFGVVESLRKVVQQLQDQDEAHYETRMLRRKLDEAKLALDGRYSG